MKISVGVLDDYQDVALQYADWEKIKNRCEISVFNDKLNLPKDIEALRTFDILCVMRERTPFPREVIAALPNLKLIVTSGAGNAAIDLKAAVECGVMVCGTGNGPGRRATAELTWALIMATARDIVREAKAIANGGWQVSIGGNLWGGTLGLYGLGHLGMMIAAYGRAFGMDVIAWSQNLEPDRASVVGARLVSREELFQKSDIVSIHQVLSDRTRGSIGKKEFSLMQSHSILINTSRGAIVVEEDLIEALDNGQIRAAGLDTVSVEPLPKEHPLRNHLKVTITPHIGYVEHEVYRTFFTDTVKAIDVFLEGGSPNYLLASSEHIGRTDGVVGS